MTLEARMAEATYSGIDELARVARGLQEALAAVAARAEGGRRRLRCVAGTRHLSWARGWDPGSTSDWWAGQLCLVDDSSRPRRACVPPHAAAHEWIGGSFKAVHRVHHAFQHRVEELAGILRITVGQQLHRPLQVGEQHRHLLALAFEGGLGGEDFLGQMTGRIAQRRMDS